MPIQCADLLPSSPQRLPLRPKLLTLKDSWIERKRDSHSPIERGRIRDEPDLESCFPQTRLRLVFGNTVLCRRRLVEWPAETARVLFPPVAPTFTSESCLRLPSNRSAQPIEQQLPTCRPARWPWRQSSSPVSPEPFSQVSWQRSFVLQLSWRRLAAPSQLRLV